MVNQDGTVKGVEYEHFLSEDFTEPGHFLLAENVNPLFECFPLSKLFEKLQFLNLIELFSLHVPLIQRDELNRPRLFILGNTGATQRKVILIGGLVVENALVSDDVHIVVVVALYFEHVVKFVLGHAAVA